MKKTVLGAIKSKANIILISAIFLLFGLFNASRAKAAPDTILSFTPSSQAVGIGATAVTLVASVDPVSHEVSSVSSRITYDETKLSLTGITCSATFGTELYKIIPAPEDGTARIDCGIPGANPAVTVLTDVATFSFTAVGIGSSSPVDFTSLSSVGADDELGVNVLLTRNGATVTVDDVLGATIPTILSVSSGMAAGSYNLNDVIDIDVTFSEAVTSTEAITVTLETGTPDRVCTIPLFLGLSATATCDYTVQAGDTAADLGLIAGTAPIATSGTIEDAVGDVLVDFVPATTLAANEALVIDTTSPAITQTTAITSPTADSTPSYIFNSDEAGTIIYGGTGCTTGNTSAVIGANTATFGTLEDGTYDCTITVTDAAVNSSNVLTVPTFTVDTTAPTGGDFVINSDDAATNSASVTLDVTCPTDSWATVQMAFGNTAAPTNWTNCVASTAHTLSAGDGTKTVYMRFRDGGLTATSDITDTISMDTGAPTVTQVAAVTSPTNDTTPNYTFNTDEAGNISYAGDCVSSDTTATSGNNTITFDTPLGAGAHTNCTITVTDALLNASTPLDVNDFTIDLTAPVISEVTAVTTPTIDNSPDYTFTTSEAGTISYGGDCDSTDDSATSGSNTITFDAMPDGDYVNCTIIVTDAATNASNTLDVTDFTVDAGVPFLSAGAPSGELNDGTTTATLAVTTDEAATCKFGAVAGTAYASVANDFTTTGGTTHSYALTGLTDDTTYNYYVRCMDVNTNVNVVDYAISFSVDKHESKKEAAPEKRKIGNTPKTVARGKILIDYGKHFSKNSEVALYFSRSDGTYYPPRFVRTNSKGSFSLAYLVPMSKMTGKYKWYAVDQKTGKKSDKQTYRVK